MLTRSAARRVAMIAAAFLAVVAAGCSPVSPLEADDVARVNQLRSAHGMSNLPRALELDLKAQAHARTMAEAGTIFHSSNLATGVSSGWQMIGENVAMAGSIAQAQTALEASPPHRENLLNPYYTEIGVGAVQKGNAVFLVQVFVQR